MARSVRETARSDHEREMGSSGSITCAAECLKLTVSFAKIGLLGFGGGPSMIPLLQREVVHERHWLTDDQFMDTYALGAALPGPIAGNLAGYVGYSVAGWIGAVCSLIGLTVPTILAMIGLSTLYAEYQNHYLVINIMTGVRPAVFAMLAGVALTFMPQAFGKRSEWGANWLRLLLCLTALVLAIVFQLHPGLLILIGGVVGVLLLS